MCLSGQKGLHWGAVKWYYGLMAEQGPGVPEGFPNAPPAYAGGHSREGGNRVWGPQAIVRHVRRCLVCRKQIDRVKEAVTGAGGETEGRRSEMERDVIDILSLHFHCLEEQVTCARVKPFLVGLLLSSVRIRIPTPITVHIDHCPECADDLNALRDLGLRAEQLERLERLYDREHVLARVARQPAEHPRFRLGELRLCRRARPRIAAFVRGHLEEIDGEILDHLCTCPRCRQHVHRCRQRLLESGPNGGSRTPIGCGGETSMARLFDYAVPYGRTDGAPEPPSSVGRASPHDVVAWASRPWIRDHGQDARATRAGTLALPGVSHEHVRACPVCLRRIQELDETIYGIAERTDSGIATVYSALAPDAQPRRAAPRHSPDAQRPFGPGSLRDRAETGEIARSVADSYPGYPIRVQVLRGRPPQAAASTAWKRATCNPQVRFLLKTAVAAAAVIPLALIFLNTSTASGTTLAQVFKAFGKAQNVHVASFYPNTEQLIQELWIARATNRVLVTERQERALYDLNRKKKLAGSTSDRSADIVDLSERQYIVVRRAIDACLGFTLGDIPAGAKWSRLHDVSEGIETYELTYTEQGLSSGIAFDRLEIAIDPLTRLPREVRTFRKRPAENEWHYLSRTECQYLTDGEMATVLGKFLPR